MPDTGGSGPSQLGWNILAHECDPGGRRSRIRGPDVSHAPDVPSAPPPPPPPPKNRCISHTLPNVYLWVGIPNVKFNKKDQSFNIPVPNDSEKIRRPTLYWCQSDHGKARKKALFRGHEGHPLS